MVVLLSLALIVAYVLGSYLYIDKSVNDYNRSLQANQTQTQKAYTERNLSVKNKPCIDCIS
ncbi:MAG TPA: hypothetical protein VN441_11900 [Syntrophomonas sp.]|nr:hypothetical protein [Syntrophomonas sp.]